VKLQLSQALATVLDIQVAGDKDTQPTFVVRKPSGIDIPLGPIATMTLEQAIWKALELANLSEASNFAVFPLSSGREDYYMAIERELLRQEASPEFEGKLMWEMMGAGDPRELIEQVMLQIRECAQAILHPVSFQESLLRVACLVISCMQWTSNWIGELRVRQATLAAKRGEPEEPKVMEFTPPPEEHPSAPVPPLFGIAGLQVVPPATTEVTVIDGGPEVPPLVLRKERMPDPEPKPKQPEAPPSKGPGNGKRKRSRKKH